MPLTKGFNRASQAKIQDELDVEISGDTIRSVLDSMESLNYLDHTENSVYYRFD